MYIINHTRQECLWFMDTIIIQLVFPVLRHMTGLFRSPSVASGQGKLCTIHSGSAGDDKGKKKKNFDWDIKLSSKIVSRLRLTELWQIILFL